MTSPLRIPHTPLSDAEWDELQKLIPVAESGRPCDLRFRFDAFFRLACTDGPWRDLPEHYGKAATVARHFRRFTRSALWERLLIALSIAPRDHPFRRLEGYICRAARRAIRIRGLRLVLLIRRLKLLRALPGPPWLCPDPDLSEKILALSARHISPDTRPPGGIRRAYIRTLIRCLAISIGRRSIPRAMKACWP